MTLYNKFIGVDIGKLTFYAAVHGDKKISEYDNTAEGIELFIEDYRKVFPTALCILETTGGYEMRLLLTLCTAGFAVHRANTRKVKHFIRSYGNDAKTDKLDTRSLALYGYERGARLELYTPASKDALALYELVQRRQDLKRILVAEKNRLQAPRANVIKDSCQIMIVTLTEQIKLITEKLQLLIDVDPILRKKQETLKTIPGIGDIISMELVILLPELGTLNRRKIASLAGLAPKANDSGLFKGYRATGYGRGGIKPILFMSAMAARNSNSNLKSYYNHLVAAGKKKIVALTALMRKILVMANARIRDMNLAAAPA